MRKLLLTRRNGCSCAAGVRRRGVTDKEIVIGTSTDLSGVTVEWGVNNTNAIRMAFEEQNAKGGINGRTIKYIVEDSQYQVPRHVQAMNKLLNRDNVFLTARERRHADEQRDDARRRSRRMSRTCFR